MTAFDTPPPEPGHPDDPERFRPDEPVEDGPEPSDFIEVMPWGDGDATPWCEQCQGYIGLKADCRFVDCPRKPPCRQMTPAEHREALVQLTERVRANEANCDRLIREVERLHRTGSVTLALHAICTVLAQAAAHNSQSCELLARLMIDQIDGGGDVG
jgi:hypothetical protein